MGIVYGDEIEARVRQVGSEELESGGYDQESSYRGSLGQESSDQSVALGELGSGRSERLGQGARVRQIVSGVLACR